MVDNKGKMAVELKSVHFSWKKKAPPILKIDELQIGYSEKVFIAGPSGSGKSTLLNLLAGVIKPGKGSVAIHEKEISKLSGAARDRFRADNIGYIFQMFNLIPYLSVVENVILPCKFSAVRRQNACNKQPTCKDEALRLLGRLGLGDQALLNSPVTELSVGQQQRVAAARALIGKPGLIICDEPTSSLDAPHRESFIQLLFQECEAAGNTLIFVSHDTSLATSFDRTIKLSDVNRSG